MKLITARDIIDYCHTRSYQQITQYYTYDEIMQAIRTIERVKSSTHDDQQRADIVYWKIALLPVK